MMDSKISRQSIFPDKSKYPYGQIRPAAPIYGICNPILRSSNFMTSGHTTTMISATTTLLRRDFSTNASSSQYMSLPYIEEKCSIVNGSEKYHECLPVVEEEIITETKMGGIASSLIGMVHKIFTGIFKPKQDACDEKSSKVPDQKRIISEDNLVPPEIIKSTSNQIEMRSPQDQPLTDKACDKTRKRTKSPTKMPHHNKKLDKQSEMVVASSDKPHSSSFNPNNFYHKNKVANKNRSEKLRHNILCDIQDDYLGTDQEDNLETPFGSSYESCSNDLSPSKIFCPLQKLTVIVRSSVDISRPKNITSTSSKSNSFKFCSEDFPVMQEKAVNRIPLTQISPKRQKITVRNRRFFSPDSSDEDDDDADFVVFDDQAVQFTPSSDTGTPKTSLKSILSRLKCRRQRQWSECSDDSVVMFCDSDDEEQVYGIKIGDETEEEEEEDDEEDDEDEEDSDTESLAFDVNQQPDSGFEERKVRFSLKPEVHVMHTWDYAYRQARKGQWEEYGRDRCRFKNRTLNIEKLICHIFKPEHRQRIYTERFAEPKEY